jgi:hypothetical protein
MLSTAISPVFWSVDELVSFGEDAIYDLAISSAGTKTSNNLLLGRCLLAVDQTRLYERFGMSGAVHFATSVLGLSDKEATTVRRVARQLQTLPLLTRAAEHGTISWSKLREVASVASAETEQLWLELCAKMGWRPIQKLVGLTPKGEIPGTCADDSAGPHGEEYRCRFPLEVVSVIERVLQQRSRIQGRPLSFAKAVEQLFTEALAGKPFDEAEERTREEARRELWAEQLAQEPLVRQAREVAEELGLLESPDLLERHDPGFFECELTEPDLLSRAGREVEELSRVGQDVDELSCLGPDLLELSSVEPDLVDLSSLEPDLLELSRVEPDLKDPSRAGGEGEEVAASTNMCTGGSPGGARSKSPRAGYGSTESHEKAMLDLLFSHLRFNPKQRHLTPAQRQALLRRDRYCCRTPGCPHQLWLHIHHVKWYCVGGETLPENVITLCTRCHRHVHEGKLRIARADGELLFTDQRGRRLDIMHRIERAAWLDYNVGWRGDQVDSYQHRVRQALGLAA